MKRSLGISAYCVLVTALAATMAVAQPAPSPEATPTDVRLYLPFDVGGGLNRAVVVVDRVSGECFTGSLASPGRPDAFRCTAGNRILDPCYQGFEAGQPRLACARASWSAEVTLLTPTKEMPRAEANRPTLPAALPWAVELADGTRCALLTGATAAAAGMRVNYGCEGGDAYVVGEPDRSLPRWRVLLWMPARDIAARLVGVTVAWW